MYRVSIMPAIEHNYDFMYSEEVKDIEAAKAIESTVARLLIMIGDSGAMTEPFSNSVSIEQKIKGEWFDVEEEH